MKKGSGGWCAGLGWLTSQYVPGRRLPARPRAVARRRQRPARSGGRYRPSRSPPSPFKSACFGYFPEAPSPLFAQPIHRMRPFSASDLDAVRSYPGTVRSQTGPRSPPPAGADQPLSWASVTSRCLEAGPFSLTRASAVGILNIRNEYSACGRLRFRAP